MWGICQANKGPALPGTGSLEGDCRETHLVETEEPPSSRFPLAVLPQKSQAAGSSPTTQACKQVAEIFTSLVWLNLNPGGADLSASFLSALKQPNTTEESLTIRQIGSTLIQDH